MMGERRVMQEALFSGFSLERHRYLDGRNSHLVVDRDGAVVYAGKSASRAER
jgi:hypothetical protein